MSLFKLKKKKKHSHHTFLFVLTKLPEFAELNRHTSPSNLLSLIDVYSKNKRVLSRISWEIIIDERHKWFLNYPFKLELKDLKDNDNDEALASPVITQRG